jgi:hypothetical protein
MRLHRYSIAIKTPYKLCRNQIFGESGDETDTFRKKGDETDTFRDETDTFAGVEEERKMSRKESTIIENNKTYI